MSTEQAPFTALQEQMLTQLRDSGWQINIYDRDRDRQLLLVDGLDNYGDHFRGQVDAAGSLTGEPVDPLRRPERFGVTL